MYNPVEEDETPLHLFFNCIGVEGLREEFYVWLLNDNNFTVSRNNFFIAFKLPNNFLNKALFVVTLLFKKFIWNCKQRKILPTLNHLKISINMEVVLLTKSSKKMKLTFENSGLNPEIFNGIQQG
jgi:hypothetical protein